MATLTATSATSDIPTARAQSPSTASAGRGGRGGGRSQEYRGRRGRGTGVSDKNKNNRPANKTENASENERQQRIGGRGGGGGRGQYRQRQRANGRPRQAGGRTRCHSAPHNPLNSNSAVEEGTGALSATATEFVPETKTNASTPAKNPPENNPSKNKSKKKRNRNRQKSKNKKRYPWRAFVPPGTVDPISLDPIVSLEYPPFALISEGPPYPVVPVWPTPQIINQAKPLPDNNDKDNDKDKHQQHQQQTSSQKQDMSTKPQSPTNTNTQPPSPSLPHLHLYDGRVLAYYLVSQLQFIDPLNRRDLTREELLNLDQYLARHGLGKAGVVDAYDNLGITKSTAGVGGQTQAGRAEILQMQARSILVTLFDGGGGRDSSENVNAGTGGALATSRTATADRGSSSGGQNAAQTEVFRNDFERLYMMGQHPQRQQQRRQPQTQNTTTAGDVEGMAFIDDDEQPEMRGRNAVSNSPSSTATDTAPTPSTNDALVGGLWSGARVVNGTLVGGGRSNSSSTEEAFPSLAASAAPATATNTNASSTSQAPTNHARKQAPSSNSLKSIGQLVKKTDPAELARQRRATEEARRKAAMNPFSGTISDYPMEASGPAASTGTGAAPPSENILRRNKLLADALGVAPASVRGGVQGGIVHPDSHASSSNTSKHPLHTGWARPIAPPRQLDEFGNELHRTDYPLPLLIAAKQLGIGFVQKLEKRWKVFLLDDKASSVSLRPMDRDHRKLVHEYSDLWRMQTESYDPEPKRYVHCVKLRDTSAPFPMLSEAARVYRGPMVLPNPVLAQGQAQGGVSSSNTVAGKRADGFVDVSHSRRAAASTTAPVMASSVGGGGAFVTPAMAPQGAMFNLDGVANSATPPMTATQQPASSCATKNDSSTTRSATNNASASALASASPLQTYSGGLPLSVTATPNFPSSAARFSGLERERPRLKLAPRTKPREMPPHKPHPPPPSSSSTSMRHSRSDTELSNYRKNRRRTRDEDHMLTLLDNRNAFDGLQDYADIEEGNKEEDDLAAGARVQWCSASSDEERRGEGDSDSESDSESDSDGDSDGDSEGSTSSSEWEAAKPVFDGNDDE